MEVASGKSGVETWTVRKFRNGETVEFEDNVITENRIQIFMNGDLVTVTTALRDSLDDLARGFLLAEGYVRSPKCIKSIQTDSTAWIVNVQALTEPSSPGPVMIQSTSRHRIQTILKCASQLYDSSNLYRLTGAVHTTGLVMDEQFLCIFDDIGRHNAYDKTIGYTIHRFWPIPEQAFLVSTGRISSDIVRKAVQARIPVMVSRSAPTGMALKLALRHGLTVVGFARGSSCNIYTGHQRIITG